MKTLQFKRFANTALSSFVGANGELVVDANSRTLTVHDGVTPGGKRLATEQYITNYLPQYGGVVNASSILTQTLYSNTFLNAVSSGAVQFQYDPSGTYNFYDLSNGNWFYLDSEGLVFQSNTNGLFDYNNYYSHNTIVLGNDGSFLATGNVTTPNIILSANSTITNESDCIFVTSKFNGAEVRYVSNTNLSGIGAENGDSYMYAQGANGVITSITVQDNTVQFASYDGVSVWNYWTFANNGTLTFPDSSIQTTAAASNSFTIAAFSKANAANSLAQSAYNAANTAAQTFPQNAQTANYVLQLSDAGKHIYYTQSANTSLYIPTTSNVAFPIGTKITLISKTSASANVTVRPNTGVSLYLAGNTTSSTRNLTTYGVATMIQVASNTWFVSGTGII